MILLGTSLGMLTAPVLFADSNSDAPNATEKKDSQLKHGKNGKDGQNGENGQDGEDGQNGGNGGNGGFGWWRGGNGGNGGNGSNEEDSSPNATTRLPSEQVDEWEYKTLKDIYRQIISITISKFYDTFDSVCLAACKQNVSNCLLQIGTAAAKNIWQEYENIKWSYPAILNV